MDYSGIDELADEIVSTNQVDQTLYKQRLGRIGRIKLEGIFYLIFQCAVL